jgi:hypothetical protein
MKITNQIKDTIFFFYAKLQQANRPENTRKKCI